MVSTRAISEANRYLAQPLSQRSIYYQNKSPGVQRLIDAGLSAQGQQRVVPYQTGPKIHIPKPKIPRYTKNISHNITKPTQHSQRKHFEIQWSKGVKKMTAWNDILKQLRSISLGNAKKFSYYFRVNGQRGSSTIPRKLSKQKFLTQLIADIQNILQKIAGSKLKFTEFECDIVELY